MNRTSVRQTGSVGMPRRWELLRFGSTALHHQHPPLRTHSKRGSMWGSTSAEKNVSSIKWNRDWCFCSTPKEINGGYREVLVPSQAKASGTLQIQMERLGHAQLQPATGQRTA